MLEEWELYWTKAGITGTRVAVLVLYENGHGLRELDGTIGWEASVAWRFLHRVFFEQNLVDGMRFDSWFRNHLPANASELTMRIALEVLKEALGKSGRLRVNEELSVFVGIDEFQKISSFDKLRPLWIACAFLDSTSTL